MSNAYDLVIIGGGINGCGIARDAQGRGLKVLLCEKGDLASATSSASTKLIHGGLRYLQYRQFGLVFESLSERETLMAMAPHLVKPQRCLIPVTRQSRPGWVLGLGLSIYDIMADSKKLPPSEKINLRKDPAGRALDNTPRKGFAFHDCRVDDARLVLFNAMDARDRGATILTRTTFKRGKAHKGGWIVTIADSDTGAERMIRAKAIINAAGPWARDVLTGLVGRNKGPAMRLVKGSHIVVDKLFDGSDAYLLQNDDGRVVFAIPYENDFTLIGTTETPIQDHPGLAHVDEDEITYLIETANRNFKTKINRQSVRHSFYGVRPLADDASANPSANSRDYILDVQTDKNGKSPLISIFGGKLTTYRNLSEKAVNKLGHWFPDLGPGWTKNTLLPGGDIGPNDLKELIHIYYYLPEPLLAALYQRHGSLTRAVIGKAKSPADLGSHFGDTLYQREVDYLMATEWARTAEDILWRRTKCGLHMGEAGKGALEYYFSTEIKFG